MEALQVKGIDGTMDIEDVKLLYERRQYVEARSLCDSLLSGSSCERIDVLRVRANVFSLSGNLEKALLDRREIISSGGGSIQDYYLGANDAVESARFNVAIEWLESVLEIGKQTKVDWFRSAALFLLACSCMEVGSYSSAKEALKEAAEIEPEVALPIPKVGLVDCKALDAEVVRRQALSL